MEFLIQAYMGIFPYSYIIYSINRPGTVCDIT